MYDEIDLFRSFLSKKGLRNTPEREKIIAEIFASHDHFDVDELFLRLRKRGSKISHASIYRNMPLIKECGLVREVWHEDGHMHYEHIYGHTHHCHLRCVACGKVIEFVEKQLEDIEKRLGKKYNFQILNHSMDVTGYCSECKEDGDIS